MKKFKFRFEAVEKVRRIEMEQQIKEVSLAERKVDRIQSEISQLDQKIAQERNRVKAADGMPVLSEILHELSINYVENLRRLIKEKKEALLFAQQELIRQRRQLVEKQKKKKAMEVLREKDEARYYEDMERQLQEQMDDISTKFWLRQHS